MTEADFQTKVLSSLTKLEADVGGLKADVGGLKVGQARLEEKIDGLREEFDMESKTLRALINQGFDRISALYATLFNTTPTRWKQP